MMESIESRDEITRDGSDLFRWNLIDPPSSRSNIHYSFIIIHLKVLKISRI